MEKTIEKEELREDLFDARANWLADHGCNGADVITDESGNEFVYMEDEENSVEWLPFEMTLQGIEFPF